MTLLKRLLFILVRNGKRIICGFRQVRWDAIQGANRAAVPSTASDWQRSSAPTRRRINPQIILLPFLIAVPIVATAAEETLGRLFFKPEERAALDRARQGIPDTPGGTTANTSTQEQKLNGYVKRSDGRSTLWVDGTPRYVPKNEADLDPSAIRTPNNIAVHPSKKSPSGK